jgi:hypothetical protein
MKKIILGIFSTVLLLVSCQNAPKTVETSTIPTPVPVPPPPPTETTNCYYKNDRKDVTAVQLTISGSEVTGFYAWEPYEKDGAHGSLKGTKTGDEITAIFKYMIEGSVESEEVIFKIADGKLLKADGELVDKKGILVIKDKTKIKWNETFPSVDCAKTTEIVKRTKETCEMIAKQ